MEPINLDSFIIPTQLRYYLLNTKLPYKNVSEDTLLEIEETYIYYKSLYYFDTSKFTECVINEMKKATSNFNDSLEKSLNKYLEIDSKNIYCHNFKNISSLNPLFNEIVNEFIEEIQVYKFTSNKDYRNLYRKIGMMDMINLIVDNKYYKKTLKDGIEVIENDTEDN